MKRTVIKLGGALLEEDLTPMWEALLDLQTTADVVIVHGGGPQTTALAGQLGHIPTIVEGRRVTTDVDLDILNWVIRGELNGRLVAEAGARGIRAAGVSGADGSTLQVHRRPPWQMQGREVDFGHVGDVDRVDPTLLLTLLQAGVLPIVCPPGVDAAGHRYNVNADTVALEVAAALGASELMLLTGSGAVLDSDRNALRRLDRDSAQKAVEEGWIAGGMKVKTDIGFAAMDRGIPEVWIAHPASLADRQNATRLIP
ncbi:MAG: acetylglutamate kinase [Bacteroidota bacterium]|nr:acetylglutamate kinase [Bacteroidota bacterium]